MCLWQTFVIYWTDKQVGGILNPSIWGRNLKRSKWLRKQFKCGQRRGYKCAFKENESDSDEGGH